MIEEFPHIHLASSSPRRSALLREANLSFTIFPVDVEETYPSEMEPRHVAAFLAEKKANAAHALKPESLILAADSIVIVDNEIFGKPGDRQDAERMLRSLSNREHLVITGICLTNGRKRIVSQAETKVTFLKLSEEEIDYYITEFQPFDKAGAYGIQDWIGWCKIESIEGSYSNVMGLPVHLVYQSLEEFI